jgi:hypothetical protein
MQEPIGRRFRLPLPQIRSFGRRDIMSTITTKDGTTQIYCSDWGKGQLAQGGGVEQPGR